MGMEFLLENENGPQLNSGDGCGTLNLLKNNDLYTLNRRPTQQMNYTLSCYVLMFSHLKNIKTKMHTEDQWCFLQSKVDQQAEASYVLCCRNCFREILSMTNFSQAN